MKIKVVIIFAIFSFSFRLGFYYFSLSSSYLQPSQRYHLPLALSTLDIVWQAGRKKEEEKEGKRKQRTEKPEDKLYFIFVLVFLFVFFSFLFLCPLLTYLISVYKSLETKRKT